MINKESDHARDNTPNQTEKTLGIVVTCDVCKSWSMCECDLKCVNRQKSHGGR
jgi:hypothetical protein